ncbi:MAG: hypothetical protein ACE5HO_21400 [bacterium]
MEIIKKILFNLYNCTILGLPQIIIIKEEALENWSTQTGDSPFC